MGQQMPNLGQQHLGARQAVPQHMNAASYVSQPGLTYQQPYQAPIPSRPQMPK